ncbi:hypothetical protein NLI96_g6847 [Meripilus lineatus]|uniref:F-box domain-containing protein n=1 Tax=Meripilus lineatus TaxID=2056292 RepID=A0AAD5V055_9APHY|nr:hypothetical protein NLI96_g6847 [Physisporinus lineatus]
MQSSKLPIEVCERVIDKLANSIHNPSVIDYAETLGSIPTLCACSLVCRDWVPRSQHHLFRCVRLCTTVEADAFLDTIARHPHRAQLVQLLSISPSPPPSLPSPLAPVPLSPTSSGPPALTSPIVPTLTQSSPTPSASRSTPSSPHSFQCASSVSNDPQSNVDKTSPRPKSGDPVHPSTAKSLESGIPLRDHTLAKAGEISTPPCCYNWIYKVLMHLPPLLINLSILILQELPTLHPRFIRLISCFKTVRALFLLTLESQSFSEIIQVVNRLPQLRSIRFYNSRWDQPARFFPSHRLRLEKLSCDADIEGTRTSILDWLGSLQDLSGLRLLQLSTLGGSNLIKLHHILQRCTHSLRYLDLPFSDVDILESLSLSSHSELESLDIWIRSSPFPNEITIFSSRIHQLLSPSLVYLIIGSFENLDCESLTSSKSSWKEIDDALSNPKFNRLEYFVMSLSSLYQGNLDPEVIKSNGQYEQKGE